MDIGFIFQRQRLMDIEFIFQRQRWWILDLYFRGKDDGYRIYMSEAKIVVWSSLARRLSTLAKIVVNVRRQILKISDNHCVIIDIRWSNILIHTFRGQYWNVQIQDQAMSLKFVEIGKVMLVWGILKNVSQVRQNYTNTNDADNNTNMQTITNTIEQTQLMQIQIQMYKHRWYKESSSCTRILSSCPPSPERYKVCPDSRKFLPVRL